MRLAHTTLALAALAGTTAAQDTLLTVDPAQSDIALTATLETIVGTRTDSDVSPIGGFMRIELDSYTSPSTITLHDYSFTTLEPIDFAFNFSVLGSVSASLPSLGLSSPSGATPATGAVLPDGTFTVEGVETHATGIVAVSGTGAVGSSFDNLMIDLSTLEQTPITVTGTVDVQNGTVTIASALPVNSSTTDPDTGTTLVLAGNASIVATGDVPELDCVADVNHDDILSPADFSAWIAAFNAQAPECDQNADGSCTPADFTAWIANYNAGC